MFYCALSMVGFGKDSRVKEATTECSTPPTTFYCFCFVLIPTNMVEHLEATQTHTFHMSCWRLKTELHEWMLFANLFTTLTHNTMICLVS